MLLALIFALCSAVCFRPLRAAAFLSRASGVRIPAKRFCSVSGVQFRRISDILALVSSVTLAVWDADIFADLRPVPCRYGVGLGRWGEDRRSSLCSHLR